MTKKRQPRKGEVGQPTTNKAHFAATSRDESTRTTLSGTKSGKVTKRDMRKVLPTKADDLPVTMFEYDGQPMWTNRVVMLPTDTIAPYLDGTVTSDGGPRAVRVKGTVLAEATEQPVSTEACHRVIETALARLDGGTPRNFDLADAELHEGDGYNADPYYLLTDIPVFPEGSRRVRVSAAQLNVALGTTDLSNASDLRVVQAGAYRLGETRINYLRNTPLVIYRGDRFAALVMPMRQVSEDYQ